MTRALLVWSLLVAGCGGSAALIQDADATSGANDVPTESFPDQPRNSDLAAGDDAETATDAVDATDTADDPDAARCASLTATYVALLTTARSCTVNMAGQCQIGLTLPLGCSCATYLNTVPDGLLPAGRELAAAKCYPTCMGLCPISTGGGACKPDPDSSTGGSCGLAP
jgi:hypothetical protein